MRAIVSCLWYGRRFELWEREPDGNWLSCGECERRFVGGDEDSQLERYIRHKVDEVCGKPGP